MTYMFTVKSTDHELWFVNTVLICCTLLVILLHSTIYLVYYSTKIQLWYSIQILVAHADLLWTSCMLREYSIIMARGWSISKSQTVLHLTPLLNPSLANLPPLCRQIVDYSLILFLFLWANWQSRILPWLTCPIQNKTAQLKQEVYSRWKAWHTVTFIVYGTSAYQLKTR